MGTNPGAWLSGVGPVGALLLLLLGMLAILGTWVILRTVHKHNPSEGEVRISWKEISVRWSHRTQEGTSQPELEATDDPPEEPPPDSAAQPATPQGGDAGE